MTRAALSFCYLLFAATIVSSQAPVPPVKTGPTPGESPVQLVRTEASTGLELWQTQLGEIWVPGPGQELMELLQWEQMSQKVYSHDLAQVRPGDIVIDCGAHVGVFSRLALRMGARQVVAVEPERLNLVALRRNFAQEIEAGKVRLVEKGVWEEAGWLQLRLSTVNTGSHSLVFSTNIKGTESIEVTTIDSLVDSLKLARVDFIKMDIEGSETQALRGALRTLEGWKPRLAISSYHSKGDPASVCSIVWNARPDYLVTSKDLELPQHGTVVPKVLFFY
jgi:FkbM family methyltransferase